MASQVCKRRVKATFPVLREFHIHLERENSLAKHDSVLPLYVPDTYELEEVVFIINVTMILKKQVSIVVTWEDCAMADYMVSSGLAK